MKFVPPALLLLFAATFFCVWHLDRGRRHLLLLSLAFFAIGAATFSQLAYLPSNVGYNTMVSAVLYVGGSLLFAEAILLRSRKHLSPLFHALSFAAIVGAIWYFYYVDQSLLVRVYVLNLGMGCIFLWAVWEARFLSRGSVVDKALFWLLFVFSLHFFPRTLLTAGAMSDEHLGAFVDSRFWHWAQFSMSVLGVAMGLGLLVVASADVILALRAERDSDPLTGLLNRRGLQNRAERLLQKHKLKKISVVVCDIDHFKTINDIFGHSAGDTVLAGYASIIRGAARSGDLVGRLGGEEFVIVLKDSPVEDAFAFAERLRAAIQSANFEGLPRSRRVTCSFGVAEFHSGEQIWTTIGRADTILYAAKRAGRNRTFAEGFQLPSAA